MPPKPVKLRAIPSAPTSDLFLPIGATGTQFFKGIDNINDADEYVSDLKGRRGLETWNKMRRGDSQVILALLALQLPILSADWEVVAPGSEKTNDPPTPLEEEATEFIQSMMMKSHTFNFKKMLREALSVFWSGYYAFEQIFGFDEEDRIIVERLDPRIPSSIQEWDKDEKGNLAAIRQRIQAGEDSRDVWIPMKKLVYFVFAQEGGDFRGTSVLRSAYKSWFFKDRFYRIQAIQCERWGVGIPKVKLPQIPNEAAKQKAITAVKNLRSHEQGFLVEPFGFDINMMDTGASKQINMQEPINHHDAAILKSVVAQFLELGMTETGSRSLGETLENLFLMSLQGPAEQMAETLNSQMIAPLTQMNYGNAVRSPRLQVSGIQPDDFERIGRAIQSLGSSNLVRRDDPLENHIRELLKFPSIDLDTRSPEPPPNPFSQFSNTGKRRMANQDMAYASPGTEAPSSLYFSRSLRPTEEHVNLREINGRLDDSREVIVRATRRIREEVVDSLLVQIKDAIDSGDPRKVSKIDIHQDLLDSLADETTDELLNLYEFGRRQVAGEMDRQTQVKRSLEEKKKIYNPKNAKKYFQAQADQMAEVATDKIVDAARSESTRAIRTESVSIATIADELRSFSENTIRKSAGFVVNEAFSFGRLEEANNRKEEIAFAEYSAILDGNTCVPCGQADGQQFDVGSPEYVEMSPPLKDCEGGNQCRCIWVYVSQEEQPAEA